MSRRIESWNLGDVHERGNGECVVVVWSRANYAILWGQRGRFEVGHATRPERDCEPGEWDWCNPSPSEADFETFEAAFFALTGLREPWMLDDPLIRVMARAWGEVVPSSPG